MDDLLEVTPVSLSYLLLGGFVVAFSMVSLFIKEKFFIGEVVLGTGFGFLIGPYCLNIFDPRQWDGDNSKVTLEIMRIVLAIGLFAIGVELPKAYVRDHAKSLLVMVVPTMAFGWFICAGFINLIFPNLDFISSLVVSACLTPTDPVLASAIIGGKFAVKNVPAHTRRIIAAESACNDGLAYPFLSIALFLTLETSKRLAFQKWILIGWIYEVVMGTVLGAVLGWVFSTLMKKAHRNGLIDRESLVAQHLSLAVFAVGVVSTLGSDDLLAAFAAGTAIAWDGHFKEHTEGEVFSSVIDLLMNCACFIYIGAWLPFNQFSSPELGLSPWKLGLLFVAFLALRRIPAILLIYKWVPDISNWREALFCGHFGPMGVGAVFISTLALSRLESARGGKSEQIQLLEGMLHPIVSFVVLCSILTHGLSIPAFWFGREAASQTMSRTLTFTFSRGSRAPGELVPPEWLSWTRRIPGVIGGTNDKAAPVNDAESGIASPNTNHGRTVDRPGRSSPASVRHRDENTAPELTENTPLISVNQESIGAPSIGKYGSNTSALQGVTPEVIGESDNGCDSSGSNDAGYERVGGDSDSVTKAERQRQTQEFSKQTKADGVSQAPASYAGPSAVALAQPNFFEGEEDDEAPAPFAQ